MATHFQARDSPFAENISPDDLARDIRLSGAAGVSISGGEPFEQAEELHALLKLLAQAGIEDIIIYSGATLEDLCRQYPWITVLASCLIDGAFMRNMPTWDGWRGSANQRVSIFRHQSLYENWLRTPKGQLQLARHGDNTFMLGIPRIEDAEKLLGLDKWP